MLNRRNNQRILIIGSGRWANEIIKEILKNITISKKYIFLEITKELKI